MNATPDEQIPFILGRRSIRAYAPGDVGKSEIERLLQAAMAAPSACAKDPWRFVVVQEKKTLEAIAAALPNAPMLASAPLGIFVCGDLAACRTEKRAAKAAVL